MPATPQVDERPRSADALASFADVRFVVALAVLVLNDHIWKAAFGNWLTGKLSDFAGLIVLSVVATVAAASLVGRRRAALAAPAIGLWFVAIKTLPAVARVTEQLFEFVSWAPSAIVVDPTDLMALVVLPYAARIVDSPRPLWTHRSVRLVVCGIAVLACTATSNDSGTVVDLGLDASGSVIDGGVYYAETATEPAVAEGSDGLGRFDREACLTEEQGGDCFRIVDSSVQRATGSGWTTEWQLFDTSIVKSSVGYGLGNYPSLKATDIVAAADGTVHVAFDGIPPIARSVGGEWDPPSSAYRPIGYLSVLILAGFGGAVLAFASRRPRSTVWAGLFALVAWALSGAYSTESLFAGFAVMLGGACAFAALFAGLLALASEQRPSTTRLGLRVGLVIVVAGFVGLLVWKFWAAAPQNLAAWSTVAAALGALITMGLGAAGIGLVEPATPEDTVDGRGSASDKA